VSDSPVVRVRNAQRKIPVEAGRLETFANQALQDCLRLPAVKSDRIRNLLELDVVLVSDRRIAQLHQKFMKILGATDVITFQHGEIVISVEMARRNARRFHSSTGEEIQLYIIHGLLHLLGFDDKVPEQARQMEATQTAIREAMRKASQ
jgi:probable rRNA maturation factor